MSLDIFILKSEKRSAFFSDSLHNQEVTAALWELFASRAELIIKTGNEETIYAKELTEEEIFEASDAYASEKAPYGDVHYCDNGMRSDKKKRFPVNTKERAKAAWSYSHHKSIMASYTSEQLARLHACIASAYKKFFGKAPESGSDK